MTVWIFTHLLHLHISPPAALALWMVLSVAAMIGTYYLLTKEN
jgi:hypothetical protein